MQRNLMVSTFILCLGTLACGSKDEATSFSSSANTSNDTTDGNEESDGNDSDSGHGSDGETGSSASCASTADCNDNNDCTIDSCSNEGVCVAEAVLSNACRPQIDVSYPPRGATIQGVPGNPVITVTGKVTSGAGAIESLQINDKAVTVQTDGSFSLDILATHGGNTLDLVAVDTLGVERRRVQAYTFSTKYEKPEELGKQMVPQALGFYLSQDALDDNDNSEPADDIATVLGIALENLDFSKLFDPNTPITSSSGYNIYLNDLNFGATKISLSGTDEGLSLNAAIQDIVGDLEFDCTTAGCIFLGGDGTGGLSVAELKASATTAIWVDANNQVQVTVSNPVVELSADDVDIWSNNGWTNFLLVIIKPFIMNGIVADLKTELTNQVKNQLGPALAQALNALEINTALALPNISGNGETIPVTLATQFNSTAFHDGVAPPDPSPPQSGTFLLSGGGYFTNNVTPYVNEGVPGRAGCGSSDEVFSFPMEAELEIGLHDDLLNQILYAAWRGGLLEANLPPELISGGNLVTVDKLAISAMLAPTASDCRTPGELIAHVGDLKIEASLQLFNKPMSFTSYTSMLVKLDITAGNGMIGIGLSDIVDIKTELTANEDNMIEAEPIVIAQLETALQDILVAQLGGGGLGGIALPEIDISAKLGLEEGTAVISIVPEGVTRTPGISVIKASFGN